MNQTAVTVGTGHIKRHDAVWPSDKLRDVSDKVAVDAVRVKRGIIASVRKVYINLCLATRLGAAGGGGAVCWYTVRCHTQILHQICPAVLHMSPEYLNSLAPELLFFFNFSTSCI